MYHKFQASWCSNYSRGVLITTLQVKVKDGNELPLKLVCYWKCEPTVTNFRLDYTYAPSLLHSSPSGKPVPPLSGVAVAVPVGGGVTNALFKPTGVWSAEQNQMSWKIDDLQPQDQPSKTECYMYMYLSKLIPT